MRPTPVGTPPPPPSAASAVPGQITAVLESFASDGSDVRLPLVRLDSVHPEDQGYPVR